MRYDSILATIGNTPHVRINHLFDDAVEVWTKLERANPGGSIKDRIARAMIADAEASGALGVAALRSGRLPPASDGPVVSVVTGGNIAAGVLARLFAARS